MRKWMLCFVSALMPLISFAQKDNFGTQFSVEGTTKHHAAIHSSTTTTAAFHIIRRTTVMF